MTRAARLQDSTRAVRAGVAADRAHGAVMPPLYLSVNFAFEALGKRRPYDYTRSGNPTRDELARALAALEEGAGAVVTASGLAAVLLTLETVLGPGDLVVAPHDGYGGTTRLLRALEGRGRLRVRFVDLSDARATADAFAARPRLLWIESPSNPLLRVVDLEALAARARAAGALTAVDNTFLTPILQKPLRHGADLTVHSTTKYLNGHGDVVGGAVVARDPALVKELTWWANALGLTGAPFDAYQTLRGLRTLSARMGVHETNARSVARALADSPAVSRVYYPGFAEGDARAIVERQQAGFGAIVSFELAQGLDAAAAFVRGLRRFTLAESLGGVESLVAHPATMTHASVDAATRARAGISDGLLRLSVGIEDVGDLLSDLEAGLRRAARRSASRARTARRARASPTR